MKLTVTVCNVCKALDRETENYEVKLPGRKVSMDLCAEHGAPLVEIVEKISPARSSASTTRRGRGRKVVSIDELESAKQAGNA